MKTIAEKHEQLKRQVLYFIIAMLIFLVLILWLREAYNAKKIEPKAIQEATLLPTEMSINGTWERIEVIYRTY